MSSAIVEEAFRAAAEVAFREWGGVEIVLRDVAWPERLPPFGDVTARLPLTAGSPGLLALRLPVATAEALTGRVLERVGEAVTGEWCADCLGETANVLAGQAKTMLYGTSSHFLIGTPSVETGPGQEVTPGPGQACLSLTYDSEVGPFVVQVCLPV